MNVLVTGGAGFIGSHTCKMLALAGHHPVTYDNLSQGHEWAVKWGPLVNGSLGDTDLLRATLRKERIEAVLHFAALASVAESMNNPGLYFGNNVEGGLNLLRAMKSQGVSKIIFASSCATYGVPDRVPIQEDSPQRPTNPYGESKLFFERALRWYAHSHGLRWAALRYFNAAGCDADLEIGECHNPETHLIPLVLKAALDQSKTVELFGNDYPTPDGTAIRDYVHVTDLADAHVKALRRLDTDSGFAVNLGTGAGYSVRQVLDAVKRVTNLPVEEAVRDRRPGDPPELVADPRQAFELLGWKPTLSSLENIVETAWAWFAQRHPG